MSFSKDKNEMIEKAMAWKNQFSENKMDQIIPVGDVSFTFLPFL